MDLSWLMFWRKYEDFDFISDDGRVECFRCGRLCVPGKYRQEGVTVCEYCAGKVKIFPFPPECFDCTDKRRAREMMKKQGFGDRTLCDHWDTGKGVCKLGFQCDY